MQIARAIVGLSLLLLSGGAAFAASAVVDKSLCARAASAFDAGKVQTIFDTGSSPDTAVKVDLDGDGKVEVISSSGGVISWGDDKRLDLAEADLEDVEHLRIVRLGKAYYVLAMAGDHPVWLALVSRGSFKAELVCEFGWNELTQRNYALGPYARIEKAAARERFNDPLIYAVMRRDEVALRLVVQRRRGGINAPLKDGQTAVWWAAWQFDDGSDVDLAFLRVMLQLGADPDAGRDEWYTALHMAITSKKVRMTDLLLQFARSVKSVPLHSLLLHKDDPDWTARVILGQLRAAEAIEPEVLRFSLDRDDDGLLRALAGSGLPLASYYRYWINGRPSLEPWLLHQIETLPDPELRRSLLSLRVKMTPHKGEEQMRDSMEFPRPGKTLLVRHDIMKKVPLGAATVVEFGISVCVHLLGGDCGTAEGLDRAARWMRNLPQDCPENLARIYDDAICILAQEYAKADSQYEMAVGPDLKAGLAFVPSMRVLGVKSIAPHWTSTGVVGPR